MRTLRLEKLLNVISEDEVVEMVQMETFFAQACSKISELEARGSRRARSDNSSSSSSTPF